MSILNLSINKEKTKALICVDTQMQLEGPLPLRTLGGRTSKICPLPHANCILAGRGALPYVHTLWADIAIGGYGDSFDSIARHFQARASTVYGNVAKQAFAQGVRELGDCFYKPELALIGWSAQRSSVDCLFVMRTAKGFESIDRVDLLCLPHWEDAQGAAREIDMSTPEAMICLVRKQQALSVRGGVVESADDCAVFAELEADQLRIYRRTLRTMN
jgi:hypothetical protein